MVIGHVVHSFRYYFETFHQSQYNITIVESRKGDKFVISVQRWGRREAQCRDKDAKFRAPKDDAVAVITSSLEDGMLAMQKIAEDRSG